MPHTSRPCNPPYGIKLKEIFADSWSHWSICQSRSHRRTQVDRIELKPGNPRFFQEIQMPRDLCNIFIGTSTSDRQKSSRTHAILRPSTEVDRTETGKSSIFHQNHQDAPKNDVQWDRLWQIDQESPKIFCTRALQSKTGKSSRNRANRAKIEHKHNKNTIPPVVEPPPSSFEYAKMK